MSRCPGCDIPVDNDGDTCSKACYDYMYATIGMWQEERGGVAYLPEGVPVPSTLFDQPWYAEELKRIDVRAETHEYTNPIIHPIE